MTLKYESEILFDLMKRDGDDTPSDVLPYESELKEKYLEQVEGAYPKLQDYRAEWLNYNLNAHLPADFPVESVSNVTNATFENVVPYAYKSAILKGNTGYRDIDTGEFLETFEEGRNLELVSVKMPVLKVTGKNLFNPNAEFNMKDGSYGFIKLTNNKNNSISIVEKDSTVSMNGVYFGLTANGVNANNGYGWLLQNGVLDRTKINNSPYGYISFYPKNKATLNKILQRYDIQFEESDTTTTYETYKSNILSTPEDLELRGIGNVKDELIVATGELTERIGEIVLNGSEEWNISGDTRPNHLRLYLSESRFKQYQNVINNRFPDNGNIQGKDIEGIYMTNTIDIQVEHSRLSEVSVDGFKNWLRENNIKVQARLTQESIKTVDLTCINEQGENVTLRPIEGTMHVNTSSQTLPPLLDMSVPVESTSQNLMSFANIVEEE